MRKQPQEGLMGLRWGVEEVAMLLRKEFGMTNFKIKLGEGSDNQHLNFADVNWKGELNREDD